METTARRHENVQRETVTATPGLTSVIAIKTVTLEHLATAAEASAVVVVVPEGEDAAAGRIAIASARMHAIRDAIGNCVII